MKTLNEYINEASTDFIKDYENVLNEIKDINTNKKVEERTLVYRVAPRYSAELMLRQMDFKQRPDTGKAPKCEINMENWFVIYVITTDKGNFYGLKREVIRSDTKFLSVFKNRITGLSDYLWTKKFDEVKKLLTSSTWPARNLNGGVTKEYEYYIGFASNYELAKQYANEIKKRVGAESNVRYYKSKIDKVKHDIEWGKKYIKEYTDKIKDLEDELVELQTLQNVGADKFNECLE